MTVACGAVLRHADTSAPQGDHTLSAPSRMTTTQSNLRRRILGAASFLLFGLVVCLTSPPSAADPRATPPAGSSGAAPPADRGRVFLTVGDAAPALSIDHWVKGDEVASFGGGKMHVVVFWTTWCQYSQAAVSVLAEVQASHAADGLTVVAVSDERLQKVVEFLCKGDWFARAGFTIGTDPDLSTQRAFMDATGMGDIPAAFLIGRDGVIEWIGHPFYLKTVLSKVLDGSWDRAAAREKFEQRMAIPRARYPWQQKMKEPFARRDWETLLSLFDQAIEVDPRPSDLKMQKFLLLISEMARPEQGYRYGYELIRDFWNDARLLNNLAWFVVDGEGVTQRNYRFARKAADRAAELVEYNEPAVLDTLARVCFEQGELALAVKWSRRAVEKSRPDDPFAEGIRAARDRYEAAANEKGIRIPKDDPAPENPSR